MGDLEGAPAAHTNFPLLSFYLCTTFKTGIALPVSLFLRNRGGLVIGNTLYTANFTFTTGLASFDTGHWTLDAELLYVITVYPLQSILRGEGSTRILHKAGVVWSHNAMHYDQPVSLYLSTVSIHLHTFQFLLGIFSDF